MNAVIKDFRQSTPLPRLKFTEQSVFLSGTIAKNGFHLMLLSIIKLPLRQLHFVGPALLIAFPRQM
jgi:hypothetical protein